MINHAANVNRLRSDMDIPEADDLRELGTSYK